MQYKTIVFELAVALLLTGLGRYLQLQGMPGGALALTGVLLAVITVMSRTVSYRSDTDSEVRSHHILNHRSG